MTHDSPDPQPGMQATPAPSAFDMDDRLMGELLREARRELPPDHRTRLTRLTKTYLTTQIESRHDDERRD